LIRAAIRRIIGAPVVLVRQGKKGGNMRKPIFTAIRIARGKGFTPDEVKAIDGLLEQLGVPSDGDDADEHPAAEHALPAAPSAAGGTGLANPASFFSSVIAPGLFSGALKPDQKAGLGAVLAAAAAARWPLSFAAYALATAFHETAATMQPVREAFWLSENWRKRHLTKYYPFYGRGYVQLTWKKNYERADKELGLGGKLLANLDLGMKPEVAAPIMVKGMEEGWFCASKDGARHTLARHVAKAGPSTRDQYRSARRIINGVDRADTIAAEALAFQAALQAGGWQT
jgi:putative chitinase